MTSRERLLAAYARQPVDRIPCSPRMNAWVTDHYGQSGLAGQLRAREDFEFDIHLIQHVFPEPVGLHTSTSTEGLTGVECRVEERRDGGHRLVRRIFRTPEGELTDVTRFPPAGDRRYGISPNPIRIEHLVKDPADLPRLRHLIPDRSRTDFSTYFAAEATLGDRGLVMLQVLSALCHRAGDAYDLADWMVLYYDNRPFFDELTALFVADEMAEINAALRAGVKHFFLNWYYNSLSAGWSPAIWKQVFAPELRAVCERIHAGGGTANFYDDGKVMPLLETFADCGIDVLQTLCPPPVADVDLAEAKRRIGARVCLMGHTDLLYVIQRGTPDQIDRAVRDAIAAAGPTGFILGTSDSIRDGTPFENVRAYFNAAARYGNLRR